MEPPSSDSPIIEKQNRCCLKQQLAATNLIHTESNRQILIFFYFVRMPRSYPSATTSCASTMPTIKMNFEFPTITGFDIFSYFGYNNYDIVATPICQAFFRFFPKNLPPTVGYPTWCPINSIPASITPQKICFLDSVVCNRWGLSKTSVHRMPYGRRTAYSCRSDSIGSILAAR